MDINLIVLFTKEKIKDEFVGFVISRGSTNGRCVYQGIRQGRYYLLPSGNKKYLSHGTPIKSARRHGNNFVYDDIEEA